MHSISAKNLENHVRTLTESIGIRLAGSVGERHAADYIAEQMRSVGAEVRVEEFDVQERAVEEELLEIYVDGKWRQFACRWYLPLLLAHVPLVRKTICLHCADGSTTCICTHGRPRTCHTRRCIPSRRKALQANEHGMTHQLNRLSPV